MSARFLRRRTPLEQMLHLLQDNLDKSRARQRLHTYRRLRTVALGPCLHLQFEDEVTLRHQAYESLPLAERRDDDAVAAQMARCQHLLPGGHDLRASVLIGAAPGRPVQLPAGVLSALHLDVAPGTSAVARVRAEWHPGEADRRTPMLRFVLEPALSEALLDGAGAMVGCSLPAYNWQHLLRPATLKLLRRDLHRSPALAADHAAA